MVRLPLITALALALATSMGCAKRQLVPTEARASQLCVVRHAQAYKNLDPRPDDLSSERLDSLTPSGEDRARALGDALPEGVAEVRSSPTQRTRQTAELLRGSAPLMVDPRLRPLEGDISWDERASAWSRGEDPRPEGGESLADGAERVESLLRQLRSELRPGEHAVAVTHGDIASILLGEIRGTPLLERPERDTLGTGPDDLSAAGADVTPRLSSTRPLEPGSRRPRCVEGESSRRRARWRAHDVHP